MYLADNRSVHLSLHNAVNAHQTAGAFQLERDGYRKGRPVNNLFTQQENLRKDKHNRENRENRSPAQTLPNPHTAPSDDICPMKMPASASMVPDVTIVGNAKFIVSIMASFLDILSLISRNLPEITIA